MNNNGILVGVFSDRFNKGEVPQKMRGKKIWYSPELKEFWITDDDKNFINKFYASKFKQFVDMDAIVFNSDSIRNAMIDEANKNIAELQNGLPAISNPTLPSSNQFPMQNNAIGQVSQPYASNQMLPQQMYAPTFAQQPVMPNNYQPQYQMDEQLDNSMISDDKKAHIGKELKTKDPSRHLFGYFLTFFIITAIIMIVILFGNDIATSVSALLQ